MLNLREPTGVAVGVPIGDGGAPRPGAGTDASETYLSSLVDGIDGTTLYMSPARAPDDVDDGTERADDIIQSGKLSASA